MSFMTLTVSRKNEDVSISYFGHQLLKLRTAAKLRILNVQTSKVQHSRFGFGI